MLLSYCCYNKEHCVQVKINCSILFNVTLLVQPQRFSLATSLTWSIIWQQLQDLFLLNTCLARLQKKARARNTISIVGKLTITMEYEAYHTLLFFSAMVFLRSKSRYLPFCNGQAFLHSVMYS